MGAKRLLFAVVGLSLLSWCAEVGADRAEDMIMELLGENLISDALYSHPFVEQYFVGGVGSKYGPQHASPGHSFGVFATQQAKYGEVLVEMDEQVTWTASGAAGELVEYGVPEGLVTDLDDYAVFTLLVLLQSGNSQSPTHTHLEILSTLAHLRGGHSPYLSPVTWVARNLQLLQPSHVLSDVEGQQEYVAGLFYALDELLFQGDRVTFPECVFNLGEWMNMYASIRAMTFVHPYHLELALVHFVTAFRHSTEDHAAVAWDEQGIRVAAARTLERLEEIRLDYWDLQKQYLLRLVRNDLVEEDLVRGFKDQFMDPAYLLLTYGLVPEVPACVRYTRVVLTVGLHFDDLAVKAFLMADLLEMPDVDIDQMTASAVVRSEGLPERLMMLSRMLSLKFRELDGEVPEQLATGKMLSLDNELRATRRVLRVLELQLARYLDPAPVILEQLAHVEELRAAKEPVAAMALLAAEQLCLEQAIANVRSHWSSILLQAQ